MLNGLRAFGIVICILLCIEGCTSISQRSEYGNKEASNLRNALHKATSLFNKRKDKKKIIFDENEVNEQKDVEPASAIQKEPKKFEEINTVIHDAAIEENQAIEEQARSTQSSSGSINSRRPALDLYESHPHLKNTSLLMTIATLFAMILMQILMMCCCNKTK